MAGNRIPSTGPKDQVPDVLELVRMRMQSGKEVYNKAFDRGLQPDPDMTVTEWADEYRFLPKASSSEPGKYHSSRTPYLREIMDNLSPYSGVREQCSMKGTQLGFTAAGENWIGYVMDIAPGPMMMVLPTVELAKAFSNQKLAETIAETPKLREIIKEPKSREQGNTIQEKKFPGGILFILGSNSGAGFRQRSIRYVFLDDVDGFPEQIVGEGDPVDLAMKRTDTFSFRKKVWINSTPETKGISRIEKAFEESSQAHYHLPCPLCGEYQALEWGGKDAEFGIKFERDEQGAVVAFWYECAHCHGRIGEEHKTDMLERGRWVHAHPDRPRKGYHLSSLYSPSGWVSWAEVIQEFLEIKGDQTRLQTWVNTRLGLSFELDGIQPVWVDLKSRCEPYPLWTIPAGGYVLTAGVDVQNDRLAVVIRAWGRDEESWLVWFGELFGDPSEPGVWKQLDGLLTRRYSGRNIVSMGVDSGHKTQEVYHYARARKPIVFAIKGASQYGRPVINRPSKMDVTWRGEVIKTVWSFGRSERTRPRPPFTDVCESIRRAQVVTIGQWERRTIILGSSRPKSC